MLPGRSAATIDLIGRVVTIIGFVYVLVFAIYCVASKPEVLVVSVGSMIAVPALFLGQAIRTLASKRSRDEEAAGYSTLIDAAGYDFRDGRTGALIRSRDDEPMGGPSARVYDAIRRSDKS